MTSALLIAALLTVLVLVIVAALAIDRRRERQIAALRETCMERLDALMAKETRLTQLKRRIEELEYNNAILEKDLEISHTLSRESAELIPAAPDPQLNSLVTDIHGSLASISAHLTALASKQGGEINALSSLAGIVGQNTSDLASIGSRLTSIEATIQSWADTLKENAIKSGDANRTLRRRLQVSQSTLAAARATIHSQEALIRDLKAATSELDTIRNNRQRLHQELQAALASQDITAEELHHYKNALREALAKIHMPPDHISALLDDISAQVKQKMLPITAIEDACAF